MDYFRPYLLPSAPLWVYRARVAVAVVLRRSSLFIAILWRGRSGEPGSCSLLLRTTTKAKREKRENGLLVRPIAADHRRSMDPPATLISEEQTSFLGIVSRAQAASAQRVFPKFIEVLVKQSLLQSLKVSVYFFNSRIPPHASNLHKTFYFTGQR